MKKRLVFLSLLSIVVFFNACQREYSFETGGTPSVGSLASDVSGDCLPKTVAGAYEEAKAVDASNYIEVQVNVTQTGSYVIASDTINGISFKASGVFTTTGLNTVRLKAAGTPFATGIQNFVISYSGTQCVVAVTTLPPGGGVPAVFSLAGSPTTCTNAVPSGVYAVGIPLTSANTVAISINVTSIGTYDITTTASNGMVFSGIGTIGTTTSPQTIILTGSGTPAAAGSTPIPITAGSSSCSFDVNVVGAAVFSINCGSAVLNGTYTEGVALSPSDDVTIDVTVTTPGAYNITGTINGMTFTASGEFTAASTSVTLVPSGTPTVAGDFDVSLNAGTSPCSFPITVDPAGPAPLPATGTWLFKENNVTFQGSIDAAIFDQSAAPDVLLAFAGFSSTQNEVMEIDLYDVAGGFLNNEIYNAFETNQAVNSSGFYFDDANNPIYVADPLVVGNTLMVTVTSHNPVAKTVTGLFSGKVRGAGGVFKDITNGVFSFTYQ